MNSSKEIVIHADGGSRGNPGPAAAGIYLEDPAENLRLLCGKYLGVYTNNFAEYQGVILGLAKAKELSLEAFTIKFFLDSALVTNQLNGLFKIKSASLGQLLLKVKQLETGFSKVSYQQIPREENSLADSAVNRALDQKKDFEEALEK